MGNWSAMNAMRAYLHTLELCKKFKNQQFQCKLIKNQESEKSCNKLVEPECIEYISALAAGNQAKLMVNVTSEEGLSPSTLALAIAAQYTGGRLICICNDQNAVNQMKSELEEFGLGDVANFKVGGELCEAIKEFKNIEFAVVDSRIVDCEEVLFDMDMNPDGSVVVLSNLFHHHQRKKNASSYAKLKRGMNSREDGMFKSGVLPIGNGMEVTKIGKGCTKQMRKSSKRTFLVYEETS